MASAQVRDVASDRVETYGSFRDSLRSPVHRWFAYPAGYSHRLVAAKIRQYGLASEHWVMDPFVGTGTTSLAAKEAGVNSIGVEAHPFVSWVAETKMNSCGNLGDLHSDIERVETVATAIFGAGVSCEGVWPALVYKCFDDVILQQLYALREAVQGLDTIAERRSFLSLALTATLRDVTSAGAGWPYIAPSKFAQRKVQRDAFETFRKRCALMLADAQTAQFWPAGTDHILVNGDARSLDEYAGVGAIDMILTSPPYLNNYDYADRTRLETYFWGMYDSWGDITRSVRDKLITAATTQIRRMESEAIRDCPTVRDCAPHLHSELTGIIQELTVRRAFKNGRKDYDLMVAGYFEDMLSVVRGAYTVLKRGQPFILVLGDSAPYGVHVRTDEIVGEIAVSVGFSTFDVEVIRARGDKWAGNSQRHHVPLRESIVTIIK